MIYKTTQAVTKQTRNKKKFQVRSLGQEVRRKAKKLESPVYEQNKTHRWIRMVGHVGVAPWKKFQKSCRFSVIYF